MVRPDSDAQNVELASEELNWAQDACCPTSGFRV